jgi:D-3-phosphoglycerate dehydrogenase
MRCVGFGNFWDEAFAAEYQVERKATVGEVLGAADVVSLHTHVSGRTRGMINRETIGLMKPGALLINTARGALVVPEDVAEACRSGRLWGYAADVLEQEPMVAPHVFQGVENIIVTPHIGSRTNESVQRQGVRAALNLVNYLKGERDFVQANSF